MKAVMGSEDLSQLAKDMRFQIMHLYDLVERENSHFWSEFFTPGSCAAIDVLDTQALKKDHKLLAQRVLAICNKSWVETLALWRLCAESLAVTAIASEEDLG
jgi:hypothetical protein